MKFGKKKIFCRKILREN